MRANRWLLILSILGLILLLFCPYLLNIYDTTDTNTINIIFSFGLFFQRYNQLDAVSGSEFISRIDYSELSYFLISPILSFIGMFLLIAAGHFFYRDRRRYQRIYSWLSLSGSLTGILGSLLFLPISFEATNYSWSTLFPVGARWYYLGAIIMPLYFFGFGIWGLVQVIQTYRRSSEITDSELRLDSLATARRNIRQIQETYDNLPVHMLRRLLDINSNEELEELRKLLPPELQYSIVGENAIFLKETISEVVDPSTIITAVRKDYCFYCNAELSLTDEICPKCRKQVLDCAICKLPVKSGEKVGQCSKCEHLFHLEHIKTWVKMKMRCPTCLRNLLPTEINEVSSSISTTTESEKDD
ncbi:MAG: hypothetical protein FK733_06115 [Asgard group archaeon]|nr:hypothetical protein [Asgard group archaeon]